MTPTLTVVLFFGFIVGLLGLLLLDYELLGQFFLILNLMLLDDQ